MKASRVATVVRARCLRLVNGLLDRYETRGGEVDRLPQPPILIVGPPRSGSTLLYQAMVQRFDVAYISNRHCRLHGAPSLVERRVRATRHEATYTSYHGAERGATAPSECGGYWYRFFPRSPHHVSLAAADPAKLGRLRRSMARFGEASRRPMVFKNLYCSLRLDPIAAALPEAVYIVMQRDLLDNARSLLAGRMRRSGSYQVWWSAEPPGIDRLRDLPPEQQVVEQIRGVAEAIGQARATIGDQRFLDVSYEQLCDDPRVTMDRIARFCDGAGVRLATRAELPVRFERSPGAAIDPDLEDALVRYAGRS